jgi:hypothetical protein
MCRRRPCRRARDHDSKGEGNMGQRSTCRKEEPISPDPTLTPVPDQFTVRPRVVVLLSVPEVAVIVR